MGDITEKLLLGILINGIPSGLKPSVSSFYSTIPVGQIQVGKDSFEDIQGLKPRGALNVIDSILNCIKKLTGIQFSSIPVKLSEQSLAM